MTFRQFAFKNIFRNRNAYAAYFLSSAFSVMIFFTFASFMFHPEVENTPLKNAVKNGMLSAEIIIFVFSFLFVLYSVGTFLKARNNEFGTYMILGISRKQLNGLVFMENMMIGVCSIIMGLFIGFVFLKLFLLMAAKLLMIHSLSFYFPGKAIGLTSISFFILFFCISAFTIGFIRVNKIIELLKGSRKPKKEPKASIVLSMLAGILLLGGYFLAYTANGHTLTMLIVPVILIVTVGTFFFFSQLSVFLIGFLKKNRKFYMKRTNILWISDLSYRIKDNARILFLVSIVSAVAFTSIATLYLWDYQIKNTIETEFIYAFNYFPQKEDENIEKNLKKLESLLEEKNILYEKVTITSIGQKSNETDPYNSYSIMKLSEYNHIGQILGLERIRMKDDEGFIVPQFKEYSEQILEKSLLSKNEIIVKNSNIKIELKGLGKETITPRGLLGTLLVVNDATFSEVEDLGEKEYFYGYFIPNWEKTLDIALKIKDDKDFLGIFWSMAEEYYENKQISGLTLFIGFFVGVIFFIAAGSFLYFRLYADLSQERDKYRNMTKIGMTQGEIKRAVTVQMAVLFFIPYVIAFIHTAFALKPLQMLFSTSIVFPVLKVLIGFLMVQVIYFLILRHRYIKNLLRYIG
ncbi:MAG: ABC transporter permease [Marinisporobacter sp.]|jgi:putative ABC transport system permease protein|nr:ABC transporter permease [Marinisporobacter sp.]